jgi:putative lipoic acid-binding regulatory protein
MRACRCPAAAATSTPRTRAAPPHRRAAPPRRCAALPHDDASVPLRDAPPGLAGLRMTPDGELVDERGKSLNALGATRFDVAVQAIRGAFPTGDAAASTERAPAGQVMDALVKYPADWLFQTIARVPPGDGRDAFAAEVAALVRTTCGDDAVLPGGVTHAAKGATYVAVRVRARVQSAAQMVTVVEVLKKDGRVKMAF